MSEETNDEISYSTPKVSKGGSVYSAPCENCNKLMKQVTVKNNKAVCPECKSENYVRNAQK